MQAQIFIHKLLFFETLAIYRSAQILITDLTGRRLYSLQYFWTPHLILVPDQLPISANQIKQFRQKDPTFNSNSSLDVTDCPRFSFQAEPLLARLAAGLPYWGILLFFNVLFFVMTYVRFLRYDVR